MGQSPVEPLLQLKGCNLQALKSKSFRVDPTPPPPGCCPQCGFIGEPASFLHSNGGVLSSPPLTTNLGLSSSVEPSSSLEVQGNGETPKLTRRKGKHLGHVYRRQPNQVYVRRSTLGLTSKETNRGTTTMWRSQ